MALALYDGLLNDTCTIYRISSSFDVDTTEYGEMDETWGIVSSGTLCRLDIGSVPIRTTRGGWVETGMRSLFVQQATDLRKHDRVLVDGEYYAVDDVKQIVGYSTDHHKEANVSIIDWTATGAETEWEDEDGASAVTIAAGRGIDISVAGSVATIKSEYDVVEYAFTFETGSTSNIASVVEDERVKRVSVQITTAFDDSDVTITVGHSGDNDALMESSQNLPGTVGIYEVAPNYKYTADSTIRLYIDAASATQGAGTLYVETERID